MFHFPLFIQKYSILHDVPSLRTSPILPYTPYLSKLLLQPSFYSFFPSISVLSPFIYAEKRCYPYVFRANWPTLSFVCQLPFSYFNSYNFYLQVIPIFLFWLIFPKTLSRGLSLAVPHLVLNACHRFVLFNPVSGVAIPRITSFRPTLIIRSFTSQTIRYVFTKTLANHVRNV